MTSLIGENLKQRKPSNPFQSSRTRRSDSLGDEPKQRKPSLSSRIRVSKTPNSLMGLTKSITRRSIKDCKQTEVDDACSVSTFSETDSETATVSETETVGSLSSIHLEKDNLLICNFRNFIADSFGGNSGSIPPREDYSLEDKQLILENINKDYEEFISERASVRKIEMQDHLDAARHLLNEFISCQGWIEPVVIRSRIEEMVYLTLEEFIFPRITRYYHYITPLEDVTPDNAAKLLTWLTDFLETMESVYPHLDPAQSWKVDRNALLEVYLNKRVRREMKEVLEKSVNLFSDEDVEQNQENNLVTDHPEQIAFVVSNQLALAKDALPNDYKEQVLAVCNDEISCWRHNLVLGIASSWKDISASRYCAIINDSIRMVDQCKRRNQTYLCDESQEEYVAAGEALCQDLAGLSPQAVTFLSEYVISQLPTLVAAGTSEWEESGSSMNQNTDALKGFLQIMRKWLVTSKYYPCILKECLDLTVQTYINSFFANTLVRTVNDPERVSKKLNDDYFHLVVFFNGSSFERYFDDDDFYSLDDVKLRLRIIQSMSSIIDPTLSPEEIAHEVKVIMLQLYGCGDNGIPAVLHLAGLRGRQKGPECIEWLRVIAQASKMLENESAPKVASYTVPDLRNSKSIRNCPAIQPNQITRSRRISEASISVAIEANKVLQRRLVARLRWK